MVGPARDVYEILGIDPSASAALAREFYWQRAGQLLEADRTGDPAARIAIDELNAALAVVMDPTLRGQYDAEHRTDPSKQSSTASPKSHIAETVERRSYRRSVFVMGLVPSVAVMVWIAFTAFSAWTGVTVTIVGFGLFIAGARWATSETVQGESPFRLLRVRDEASSEELDAAYERQVHEILLGVTDDPQVLRRLELLDEAYLRASALIAEGASGQTARRLRGADWVGWQAERAGRGLLHLVHRGALITLRATASASSAVGWRTRRLLGRAAGRVRRLPRHGTPQADTAQVERRLADAFRGVSERVATSSGPSASGVGAHEAPRLRAALVLPSPMGVRRIAIGTVPIRIGSAATSDVVLKEPGVALEHALVWQRGELVLIHVTDQYASCLINDRPMSWATLDDGDVIQLGEATIRVEVGP